MSVNLLTVEQASAIMTELYEQTTGQKATAAVNASNFVSIAQATLRTGYDPVISAISQVLGRTIFSIRPYTGKFKDIEVDSDRFGAITRKINYIDTPIENDDRLTLTDGYSVDMFKVQKPKVLETHYYGANQYQKHITIFRDQLDTAFTSLADFNRFISGVMQNVADQLEQMREEQARLAVLNMMAMRYAGGAGPKAVNVITEYNAQAETTVTNFEDLFAQGTIGSFAKWFYAKIKDDSDIIENRSVLYHDNVTNKEIMRHTPKAYQRLLLPARMFNSIDTNVLSVTFNDQFLTLDGVEKVPFWQNIADPYEVNFKGVTMEAADGDYQDMESAQNFNALGILFDRDALGIVRKSTWMEATPFNAAGGYYNIFYHITFQSWVDATENAILYYAPVTA